MYKKIIISWVLLLWLVSCWEAETNNDKILNNNWIVELKEKEIPKIVIDVNADNLQEQIDEEFKQMELEKEAEDKKNENLSKNMELIEESRRLKEEMKFELDLIKEDSKNEIQEIENRMDSKIKEIEDRFESILKNK